MYVYMYVCTYECMLVCACVIIIKYNKMEFTAIREFNWFYPQNYHLISLIEVYTTIIKL